jgi:peptide/nickel transport system permease protein
MSTEFAASGRRVWTVLRRQPLGLAAAFVLLLVVVCAVFAPWIAPYNPDAIDLASRLQPPSASHWAGTDEIGRDLLSRLIHGARASLGVGFGIVLIGASLGIAIGSVAGYLGGVTDAVIGRIVDILLAMPAMVVALALSAALGPGLGNAMIALGSVSVPMYARLARGQALSLRERDFVRASRALGAGTMYQLRYNIVPNLLPAAIVFMTFHLGTAILAASALSFIGLGAQAPLAEWGALVSAGRSFVLQHWWYAVIPGAVIVVTAAAINLLGDVARDVIDARGSN